MEYVFSELVQDAYNEKRQAGIITIWGRTLIDTSQSLVRQHLENQKGKESMSSKNTDITLKSVGKVALITLGILLLPLIGSQFIEGFNWDETDFMLVGLLVFGLGMAWLEMEKVTVIEGT